MKKPKRQDGVDEKAAIAALKKIRAQVLRQPQKLNLMDSVKIKDACIRLKAAVHPVVEFYGRAHWIEERLCLGILAIPQQLMDTDEVVKLCDTLKALLLGTAQPGLEAE